MDKDRTISTFPYPTYIVSHPLVILDSGMYKDISFNQYVSLVESTQLNHVFLIHSANLCLSIGLFNPFMFDVIIGKDGIYLYHFAICFLYVYVF